MKQMFRFLFKLTLNYHLLLAALIMVFVAVVITLQIGNRSTFANTELYNGVIDRWGAPIAQEAPSFRYVPTGTVFTSLEKLPFAAQQVDVAAEMNYRKRGLFYFSGFDFRFRGSYTAENISPGQIDCVFVFPINLERNKVLLSDLSFYVDGRLEEINLLESKDKLVWTGRLEAKQQVTFRILYNGRGLDRFNYLADPALPVKNFHFTATVKGGVDFDYAPGVVPATSTTLGDSDAVSLAWEFPSLESGVPVGLILPSEKAYDKLISIMLRRSLLPFLLFFLCLIAFYVRAERPFPLYQAALLTACYSFFYVLLPYFTAYMNFYLAYVLSLVIVLGMYWLYFSFLFSLRAGLIIGGCLLAALFLPTLAVILEGHTGLIYTLEILAGLVVQLWLSIRKQIDGTFTPLYKRVLEVGREAPHA